MRADDSACLYVVIYKENIYGLIEKRQLCIVELMVWPCRPKKPQKCKNLNIIRFVFKYTDHEGGERTTDAGYESLRIFNTCKSDFLWRPFCLVILHNGLVIHQNYNLDNNFKLNSWKEKKVLLHENGMAIIVNFLKNSKKHFAFFLTFDPVWFTY